MCFMVEQQSNRRLVAIMVADVVGYSRMMGTDETGTLTALKRHRENLFDPAVAAHHGRVVKLVGDGALVEFGSVVDAVNCALVIQRAINSQSQPNEERVFLRIGINLGDVIIDGDDIYGDGVNVAARLEALAEPGGICLSSIVNESIGSRVDVTFSNGGEVTVKNIDRPIRVWKWHPGGGDAIATETPLKQIDKSAASHPERASIAVLPFDNMSGDPEQEYFSDGISEDIITDLSKVGGLLVIARNSSFAYKGKSVDIRTVGRELGVAAVLEGSIRRAGNRVRINAQLIDTAKGAHLWADRYDRELSDIFAVQDEVTRQIVEALKVTLTPAESVRIAQAPTRSVEAHDLFLRGREALLAARKTKDTFQQAVDCFTKAIELDADYAEPYVGLAHAYNHDFQNHWSGRTDSRERSGYYSRLALEKDPNLPYAHYMAALTKLWERDFDGTSREIDIALALNPNFALAMAMRGIQKIYGGAPLDAIPDLEHALRLDPLMDNQYWHFTGSAYLVAEQYEKAAEAFRERIRLSPETDLSRGMLISALGHMGEIDEARRVWAELKGINPKYSFSEHIGRLPFNNPADADKIREGYAKTGLVE
jgi:adenylate cyclase